MKNPFAKKYPNIARWVEEHEGVLELGYDVDSPIDSFVRAIDCGGMPQSGKDSYESIDAALLDADRALAKVLKDIYGEQILEIKKLCQFWQQDYSLGN